MSDEASNSAFVIAHFDNFVNRRDLDAIERNMAPGFIDHDGPGGKTADRAMDRAMMAKMHGRGSGLVNLAQNGHHVFFDGAPRHADPDTR